MKSEYPFNPTPGKNDELTAPPPSRFLDEKISDESGTETKSNSALAPAGLKNPFWNKLLRSQTSASAGCCRKNAQRPALIFSRLKLPQDW